MSAQKKRGDLKVLGVMTGTSCDGLDAACLKVTREGWEILWTQSAPYPDHLRKRVLEVQRPSSRVSTKELLVLNRDLGQWYAQTLGGMIKKNKPNPDVIANHGQTIAHFPEEFVTLQLGEPTSIAQATQRTVISHFREGDLAAGGQGAPLVPMFHRLLAHHIDTEELGVSIHNLGGISNFTYVSPKGQVIAFDTGPANLWIDMAVQHITQGKKKYDPKGMIALNSTPDMAAVKKILSMPYFQKSPPKSTGRDDFPFEILLSATSARDETLVATAAAITVESIAQAYERWILGKKLPLGGIFLSGGGAKNLAVLEGLAARLESVEVHTLEEAGIDPKYVEAQAFALYGFFSLIGNPIGGKWTGAQGFGPPGQITPGENWPFVAAKLSQFI